MSGLAVFLCGLVFGLGLWLGGMTQASNVVAFLDITGDFDPSLAWVMIGAIATYGPLARGIARRGRALDGTSIPRPQAAPLVDRRLVAGAMCFGVGWGLSGVCPGPALVAATFGGPRVWAVLLGMLAGFVLAGGRPRAAGCGAVD